MPDYKARILNVEAFRPDCPQHITPRYTMEEIKAITVPVYEHIVKLEKEIEELKKAN